MNPWLESAVVVPLEFARPVVVPVFAALVVPPVFPRPAALPLFVAETALCGAAFALLCSPPPALPVEPEVSPAAGTALSTPAPSSVYMTTLPGAAAPEAPLALEGPAVQPPGADGIEPLLVAIDTLDGAVLGPLPTTVTMPPVPEE